MLQIHRPLSRGSQEIRLIRLHPSTDLQSSPECDLIYTSLQHNIEYEGLSYVWGNDPDEKPKQILLDSRQFDVKYNLEEALRHLRYLDKERILWVDALCIDQNNLDERNQQVQMMKDIYSCCKNDLFWLGPDDELYRMKHGMKVMEELASDNTSSSYFRKTKSGRMFFRERECEGLAAVFKDPKIWNRVWVMQEIACAPKVTLVGGLSSLDWESVATFLARDKYGPADAFHTPFSHGSMDRLRLKEIFQSPQVIAHQRRVMRERNGNEGCATSTLLDVLTRFKEAQSTDPRDKIYGLLGLALQPHNVVVNYNKTAQQVFTETAEDLINCSGNLDILCQRRWRNLLENPDRTIDLPSWVPDLTAPGEPPLLFAQRSIFKAGEEHCRVPCKIFQSQALYVDGIRIGKLELTMPPKADLVRPSGLQDQGDGGSIFTIIDREGHDSEYHPTGEPLIQAYWRTLVADCKAYPIERLSERDIEEYNVVFHKRLTESVVSSMWFPFKELDKGKMWLRMREGRQFAKVDNGFFAMVPKTAQKGDMVVVLGGAKTPIILREIEQTVQGFERDVSSVYTVVGSAYVHGFMDGEAASWSKIRGVNSEEFVLV